MKILTLFSLLFITSLIIITGNSACAASVGEHNPLVDTLLKNGSPNASLLVNLGIEFSNIAKYNELVEAFNQALSIDPENIDAWNNKGSILVDIGRLEDASKAFNQALLIDPENAYAKENLEKVSDKINELTLLKSVEILKTKMEIPGL
ncbi:MAG: tetratricopeptide repeat protein [Methanomicrobiales archaeon]|nr:tetratricopeptide repeat protein [Methanomicrobiales archaeon]